MSNAAKKIEETVNKQTGEIKEVPKKPERTPQETENLRRAFQLGFNNYIVGSVEDNTVFDKLHNHVFQGDGDYIIVNNRIGNFISRIREIDRPGLPIQWGKNLVKLKVPKIPGVIYHQIVAFFRDIAKEMGNAEAFIQVYYDLVEKKYVCHVPEQTVSAASVRYDATKNLNEVNRARYIFVFEIHSHNTMSAFFSGTDNGDEKDTRFYGVLGKIHSEQIDEKYRYLVMGKEFLLTKEDIFDFSEGSTISKQALLDFINTQGVEINKADVASLISRSKINFPKKWRDRVKKYTYTAPTQDYVGGKTGGHSYKTGGYHPEQKSFLDEDDMWEDSWHYNTLDPIKKKDSEMTSYNDDDLPADLNPSDLEVDLDEIFNIEDYEEESHPMVVDAFVGSLSGNDVELVLDALVDHGHDGLIQMHVRR